MRSSHVYSILCCAALSYLYKALWGKSEILKFEFLKNKAHLNIKETLPSVSDPSPPSFLSSSQETHRDIQIATFGLCLTLGTLNQTLVSDPLGLNVASPPYCTWDLMHGVQLMRMLTAGLEGGRRFDADAQVRQGGVEAKREGVGKRGEEGALSHHLFLLREGEGHAIQCTRCIGNCLNSIWWRR
jgi:hypothetical protein